jgi:DNA-binding NtrC family response regulator
MDSLANPRQYGLLVADDEPAVCGILNAWMSYEGFTVWLAANGEEALDLYWRRRESIDVILLDVRMPGLDGPQTLAAIQDVNPEIRCCFMSGDFGTQTEVSLLSMGAAAVIMKPFRLPHVAEVLGQLAAKAPASLPNRKWHFASKERYHEHDQPLPR